MDSQIGIEKECLMKLLSVPLLLEAEIHRLGGISDHWTNMKGLPLLVNGSLGSRCRLDHLDNSLTVYCELIGRPEPSVGVVVLSGV
jgi:hypothetical protein